MQTKTLFSAILLAALSIGGNAQATTTVTSITPKQSSLIVGGLSSYIQSLNGQPAATSVASVLQTALPSSVLSEIDSNPAAFATMYTNIQTVSWYTALPTDVQSYIQSIGSAEVSIVTKALAGAGPKPTGMAKGVAGVAAVAAGAVGMVMM